MDALQTFTNGDQNYVAKHNQNVSTLTSAIVALESGKENLSAKGAPNGYAGLDENGHIEATQVPDLSGYQTIAERGAVNGYAPLDATGRIPNAFMPPIPLDVSVYQAKIEKGAANGYAGLDADAIVPDAQLPAELERTTAKDQANGYAGLGSDGKLAAGQIPAQPYDIPIFYPGVPENNGLVARLRIPRAVTFPADLTGSYADAVTAATGSTTLTIRRDGSPIGSIVFGAGSATASFTFAAPVTFAAGDLLTVTNQASADATLADISITIVGTR